MNGFAVALIFCLLGQAQEDAPPYEPQLMRVPRQGAPAASLEDAEPPQDAGAEEPSADLAPEAATEAAPAEEAPAEEPDRYRQHEPAPARHHADDVAPASNMEPLENRRQKLRPPELIAEALENPKQGALVGNPLSLAKALERAPDRASQLRIAHAYWRLATAQADYYWAHRHLELLREQTQSHTNTAGVLSARATVRADVRDAQLDVEHAQHALAELINNREDRTPPLASDRPHVGEYRTDYEKIFSNRLPPPRIRLIHRTLPVRRRAIDAHGEAIVAAVDAVESAGEEFRQSGRGLATLMGALALLKQERIAFIADVQQYNLDIAEYAFLVAPANAKSDVLVSMLIRTPAAPTASRLAPPAEIDDLDDPNRRTMRKPATTDGAAVEKAQQHSANYQPDGEEDSALYQGLLSVNNPPMRVQKLGNLLHWDRNLPADAGKPLSLAECLRGVPAANRLPTIEAYWRTREMAARYQVMADQIDQLTSLQAVATAERKQPGIAEASVRLQAARRAARGALADAELELLAAEMALSQALGRRQDETWFVPSTPPQSGRYIVDIRDRRRANSPGARYADLLTLEFDKLKHRSDAVIQCDAHRADLIAQARRGEDAGSEDTVSDELTSIDRVLWAIHRQNQQTMAFLHDLSEYNGTIARYALATLPGNVSAEVLAGKLAIARTTRRDS